MKDILLLLYPKRVVVVISLTFKINKDADAYKAFVVMLQTIIQNFFKVVLRTLKYLYSHATFANFFSCLRFFSKYIRFRIHSKFMKVEVIFNFMLSSIFNIYEKFVRKKCRNTKILKMNLPVITTLAKILHSLNLSYLFSSTPLK